MVSVLREPLQLATGTTLRPARYSLGPQAATQSEPSELKRSPAWQAIHVLLAPVQPPEHDDGQHCVGSSTWQPWPPQSTLQTAVGVR